jgi:hypothetical protein
MDLILIISLLKASVAYLVSSTEPGVTIAQQQQAIEFANKATILAIQALQNSQSIQAQPANTQQITAIQQVSQTSQQTSQNIVTSQENQTVQNIQTNQSNSQTNKDTQTQSVVLGSQTPQDEQVDYGTAVLCFIEPGINCQNKTKTKEIYISELLLTFWNRNVTSTVTIKDKDKNVISFREVSNPNIPGINTDIKVSVKLPQPILLKQAERPTVLFFETTMGVPIRITNIKYSIDNVEHIAYQD